MSKKGFDLAALAKEAMGEKMSNLDIETVEMIPAARIRANEANFYEMSDLEALAASIELVGLMTPVTVKVDQTGGAGYVIIDGERRFRALTEILGRTEIPCIRKTPVNAVIEELMLIEANRQQRKMTAGEISRQAERYTELLAKLRDSGVPIPGRLRKAVAEAMQLSESKLARLSAIRKNLAPEVLAAFDRNEINESTAYELSHYAHGQQMVLFADRPPTAGDVELEARMHGFSPCRGSYKPAPEPKPVAAVSADPGAGWDTGTSGDAETYLSQRQQEDVDFYIMLGLEADHFLAQLAYVTSRQDGIQTLKEHFGRDNSGWYYDKVQVNCSMKGLELGCEDRAIPFIERTWPDVYDMLCRFALARAARMSPVSEPNAAPAGLHWQKVENVKPPRMSDGNLIFWGCKGLKTVAKGVTVSGYIDMWPEEYVWWAEITEPEDQEAEE